MHRTLNHSLYAVPEQTVVHLQPELWAQVNRLLVCKAIAEFAHELLIEPVCLRQHGDLSKAWAEYQLGNGGSNLAYRFRAKRLDLDHWHIDANSLVKTIDGVSIPLDALAFIIEFKAPLGITDSMMPVYLDEISSTLYSSAYKRSKPDLRAEELARANFQTVETGMSEGHPVFVANNGRLGFDAVEYRAYAPEAAAPVQLVWLAVRKTHATFASIEEIDEQQLIAEELGAPALSSFKQHLRALNLSPDDYLLMPTHPWQWFNKLSIAFAADLANRHIVCLGYGQDHYLAQQSIRTLFNISHPHKRYVKTSLSILNLGFMRGLSPYYMEDTPAINAWLKQLIDNDPYLSKNGFCILREVASVGYHNWYYEESVQPHNTPYHNMLGVLWRESPMQQLEPGQRLMTMAALLHKDSHGDAVLNALIHASSVDPNTWLRCYLRAYLAPLLHCFYAHDLVFMPHGENLILVLENHVPVRVLMKDIGEEIAVLNPNADLPDKVKRIAVSVPETLKMLSLFTHIFHGFFRFVSVILSQHSGYPVEQFWRLVAECIHIYQEHHPQYAEKFARHDLFARKITYFCQNRLQLNNNRQMLNLVERSKYSQFFGTLQNPIAAYRTYNQANMCCSISSQDKPQSAT